MRNIIATNIPPHINFFSLEDYLSIWDGYFNEIDYYESYEGPEDSDIHELQEQWYNKNRERLEAEAREEKENYKAALEEYNQMVADYYREQFSDEEWAEITRRD